MKEHPILFNGEMVRAILDRRKTQTRRPCVHLYDGAWCLDPEDSDEDRNKLIEACPFGVPGDRLWVREAWQVQALMGVEPYTKEQARIGYKLGIPRLFDVPAGERDKIHNGHGNGFQFRPSIHMPRWASRISLEITTVCVERVQDIYNHTEWACSEGFNSIGEFTSAWNDMYFKRGFGWTANPWVWAITFKRLAP
jgi:hypothetical protein